MEFGREVVCDYLERNKIPKLENLKLDLSGAIDGMMDFNIRLDEIARDIQKRKDNAMAMEFTKDIGDLLKKNGVCPKFEEYSDRVMGETKIEMRYGVGLVDLDFSEHDKPFEDKIDKLEKELSALRRRCNSESALHAFDAKSIYRLHIVTTDKEAENAELKKRISELDMISDENKKLKQRIAELESEKSEKPAEINFNDQVKVKLTPLGVEIYYHQYDELNKKIKENGGKPIEPRMPQIDKDGYTKFALWEFMELYGQHIRVCKPNVVSPLYIELCLDEWKIRYDKEPIEKGEKK